MIIWQSSENDKNIHKMPDLLYIMACSEMRTGKVCLIILTGLEETETIIIIICTNFYGEENRYA
jgi:hypothetical protein